MDVWWLCYFWGYSFSGVGGMGQMQNKRYTLGMTSLPCHSRHEHSKHSRSRVGVLVHETRPSRWGSSVMEDLGLQKTLKELGR